MSKSDARKLGTRQKLDFGRDLFFIDQSAVHAAKFNHLSLTFSQLATACFIAQKLVAWNVLPGINQQKKGKEALSKTKTKKERCWSFFQLAYGRETDSWP